MNIHTVRKNLQNTIEGKQSLLLAIKNQPDTVVNITTMHFLKVNIEELQNILKDVEECCEKALADSWTISPDRMGQ